MPNVEQSGNDKVDVLGGCVKQAAPEEHLVPNRDNAEGGKYSYPVHIDSECIVESDNQNDS